MAPFEDLRAEEHNGMNVSVVKAALALIGENCGAARPPAGWPLTEAQLARLRKVLAGWELETTAAPRSDFARG